MIFLKCLYLLFLIDGICLSIKAIMSEKTKDKSWQEYFVFHLVAWFLGALWIFLLLKFFKIMI